MTLSLTCRYVYPISIHMSTSRDHNVDKARTALGWGHWPVKKHACQQVWTKVSTFFQTGTRLPTVHPAHLKMDSLVWFCQLSFNILSLSTSRWLGWDRLPLLWCRRLTLCSCLPLPSWPGIFSRTSSSHRYWGGVVMEPYLLAPSLNREKMCKLFISARRTLCCHIKNVDMLFHIPC